MNKLETIPAGQRMAAIGCLIVNLEMVRKSPYHGMN